MRPPSDTSKTGEQWKNVALHPAFVPLSASSHIVRTTMASGALKRLQERGVTPTQRPHPSLRTSTFAAYYLSHLCLSTIPRLKSTLHPRWTPSPRSKASSPPAPRRLLLAARTLRRRMSPAPTVCLSTKNTPATECPSRSVSSHDDRSVSSLPCLHCICIHYPSFSSLCPVPIHGHVSPPLSIPQFHTRSFASHFLSAIRHVLVLCSRTLHPARCPSSSRRR
ncbi:hypothetical protein B0H15DRAFT_376907 [Mycena belliarum]|uniref:Uncharacterized protein n=1 Tax=Mycena belliarum TaxID=1033014 RepID=A0AAD6U5H2_9AGAR|nr:hypothetical protein B0H15DRAFT_376907 [Mycena belliae]